MKLNQFEISIYENVEKDFNYIEYIEIIKDGAFLRKSGNLIKKLKIGDVISIQYIDNQSINVTLNDDIEIYSVGLSFMYGRLDWIKIYYGMNDAGLYNWNDRVYKYITKQRNRDNKLKLLLNETI